MSFLEKDGFAVIKGFLPNNKASEYIDLIKINIVKAAHDLGVTVRDYLSCTGRWSTSSPITSSISVKLEDEIKNYLENLIQSKIIFKKSNVICKTADLTDPIPFHQDISYSRDDPYHFSFWLSLNNVDNNSAPLQIVKNSHNQEVKPAVDFWFPYFTEKYNINDKDVKSITVNAGDAIMFDSKLWHGSAKNHSNKDRFAYVTRWVIEGKEFPSIPEAKPKAFGMFNCGKLTDEILQKSLTLFDLESQYVTQNKEKLILTWLEFLQQNPNIDEINTSAAIIDLKKLNMLNKACGLHDAGNISGLVYKNLWFSLLYILNNKFKLIQFAEPL